VIVAAAAVEVPRLAIVGFVEETVSCVGSSVDRVWMWLLLQNDPPYDYR
jgi:hypothetical protein